MQRVPKKSQKQATFGKKRARKLYERLNRENVECIVVDDETYVKFYSETLSSPQFYTKQQSSIVSDIISTVRIEKIGEKALVWQTICSYGLKLQSFVTKGTMNAQVYEKECLKKRLVQFYEKNKVSGLFVLIEQLQTTPSAP